jgi:uncharacterized membrane protein YgaE (UPF0421/DUF939 family)
MMCEMPSQLENKLPGVKVSAFLASLFFCMFKYRFFLICILLAMYPTVAYSANVTTTTDC